MERSVEFIWKRKKSKRLDSLVGYEFDPKVTHF
jgi:hypothetical protein